jgi:hypothetical protein
MNSSLCPSRSCSESRIESAVGLPGVEAVEDVAIWRNRMLNRPNRAKARLRYPALSRDSYPFVTA